MENKKSGCLSIIVLLIVIFCIAYAIEEIIRYYKKNNNESNEVALSMSCEAFVDSVVINPKFGNKYNDKYIELNGVNLGVYNQFDTPGKYIIMTSGVQTDTAYIVGRTVKWPLITLNDSSTACDSFMYSYGKRYNLTPAKTSAFFVADLVNDDKDSLVNFTYMKDCKLQGMRSTDYQLENFCIERVVVKGKLTDVSKKENGYRIELENTLILSRTPIKKKFIWK